MHMGTYTVSFLLTLCLLFMSRNKHFSLFVCAEFVWVQPDDVNGGRCASNSTECDIYVSSVCDSNCSGREYHCPNATDTCVSCDFRCNGGANACENVKLYTYHCQSARIWSTSTSQYLHKGMIVYAPINGTLTIDFSYNIGSYSLENMIIYGNDSKSVEVSISARAAHEQPANVAQGMIIYGQNVSDTIDFICQTHCGNVKIYCPNGDDANCVFSSIINGSQADLTQIYTNRYIDDGLQFSFKISCNVYLSCCACDHSVMFFFCFTFVKWTIRITIYVNDRIYCNDRYSTNCNGLQINCQLSNKNYLSQCTYSYGNDSIWQCDSNIINNGCITPTTLNPTSLPTFIPSSDPSSFPSNNPTIIPTHYPTNSPTTLPTNIPSHSPSTVPTQNPTRIPSTSPSNTPVEIPSYAPSYHPTTILTTIPTKNPTKNPTDILTANPTSINTVNPTSNFSANTARAPTNVAVHVTSPTSTFATTINLPQTTQTTNMMQNTTHMTSTQSGKNSKKSDSNDKIKFSDGVIYLAIITVLICMACCCGVIICWCYFYIYDRDVRKNTKKVKKLRTIVNISKNNKNTKNNNKSKNNHNHVQNNNEIAIDYSENDKEEHSPKSPVRLLTISSTAGSPSLVLPAPPVMLHVPSMTSTDGRLSISKNNDNYSYKENNNYSFQLAMEGQPDDELQVAMEQEGVQQTDINNDNNNSRMRNGENGGGETDNQVAVQMVMDAGGKEKYLDAYETLPPLNKVHPVIAGDKYGNKNDKQNRRTNDGAHESDVRGDEKRGSSARRKMKRKQIAASRVHVGMIHTKGELQ